MPERERTFTVTGYEDTVVHRGGEGSDGAGLSVWRERRWCGGGVYREGRGRERE
jgi:hypothetical protein